jgi:hypothetical protein
VRAHPAEGARRHAVLKAGEDLNVLLWEQVWAAAEGLADLDHEALKAQGTSVDSAGTLAVVAARSAFELVPGHPVLAGVEGFVAAEDVGGHAAGIAKADNAYVTQLWNGHQR